VTEQTNEGMVYDPQDLERLLVARENLGDVDEMAALYEPQALLDSGGDGSRLLHGREAIRRFYSELVAAGRKFAMGEQRPAMICGDLALTSTRSPDGTVTAEVARRQMTEHGSASSTSSSFRRLLICVRPSAYVLPWRFIKSSLDALKALQLASE
jgi:hypothetical protein